MATKAPYLVHFNDLPTHRRFEVPSARVDEWIRGLPMRDAVGAPVGDPEAGQGVAELDLYAEEAHGFASGTFQGHLVVACSRCLEPMKLVIDEKLMVTFMPLAEMPADADDDESEEGEEVETEDLDLFPYEGDSIDLEPLFREQFVLAIPYAPLCREDCKGLCPQCGIDRNTGTCTCSEPIDPRLAALVGLKGLKLPP